MDAYSIAPSAPGRLEKERHMRGAEKRKEDDEQASLYSPFVLLGASDFVVVAIIIIIPVS